MTGEFYIEPNWLASAQTDPIERSTFAELTMRADGQVATELEDIYARTVRPGVRASAYTLALWLTENWWRIRWEPQINTVGWRLSHFVAAAGDGVAWPVISFASDGVDVLIDGHKTSPQRGSPVRYLNDLDIPISAAAFEAGIDSFVEAVLARLSNVGITNTELNQLWEELRTERAEPQTTSIRKLEALLGFDPGEAPNALIQTLKQSAREVGENAVDEMAAAGKAKAALILRDIVEHTQASDVSMTVEPVQDFAAQYIVATSIHELPWQRAKLNAPIARAAWGAAAGPVSSRKLSEIFSISENQFRRNFRPQTQISAGFRQNASPKNLKVVLRAKYETGRRFDILRLAADHLAATDNDKLLPATLAKTDRQKFQRAFAQEFLLPSHELIEELGHPEPGDIGPEDERIDDVAEKYIVSPLMVRTTLVNLKILPRGSLELAI